MMRVAARNAALLLLGLQLALAPAVARAQTSEGSKAAAESLFNEAVVLMDRAEFAAACAKFQASQKLDPALGTVLRLADCFDRVGRTASAWALFKEAASTASNRNQPERQLMATERASELEKRLSWLKLEIAAGAPLELELRLNGIVVPTESFDSALPVDPGEQRVEVSAAGYKPWRGSVDVPTGPTEQAIEIPSLELAPPPPRQPIIDPYALHAHGSPGATQRTIGFIAGGLGLAALAASGLLSYRAADLENDSLEYCRRDQPNACTAAGVTLREEALDYARVATYPFVAGAALLATGTLLVLTAPSDRRTLSSAPKVTAVISPWDARLGVESPW